MWPVSTVNTKSQWSPKTEKSCPGEHKKIQRKISVKFRSSQGEWKASRAARKDVLSFSVTCLSPSHKHTFTHSQLLLDYLRCQGPLRTITCSPVRLNSRTKDTHIHTHTQQSVRQSWPELLQVEKIFFPWRSGRTLQTCWVGEIHTHIQGVSECVCGDEGTSVS